MADDAAKAFLIQHKLGHLIEIFEAAGATKAEFNYLRQNLVELMALVPQLTDRRKFAEAFDAEQASSSSAQPVAATNSKAVSIRANLETICQSSDEGKKFWVIKDKQFDENERKLLARVITKYFFEAGGGSISMQMFYEMVKIIQLQFPKESCHTYYVPGSGKIKPRGKLFSAYRTLQEHQREQEGPKKGKRVIKKVSVTKHDKFKEQATQNWSELSEKEKDECNSSKLRLNTIPYNRSNEIFECWDECFPIRRHEIMSETFKMSEYNILYNFEKANELISKDFVQVNGQFLHISSKLPCFLKKFSKIFQGYRKNFRDDQKLTDEIVKTFNNETAINDRSIFLAFYSLPLILRENFVSNGEKRFRPSLFMTREAFITMIPV
ncbi:uncharacterized protein LOC120424563 isoform X3 [Culex pipiens pallens]|uniref:uncharacterized protein LOC120424563 isoform X3 n=1 Tax=Culex pipiens pallens TaxID=42434 RepID=UPI0022AB2AC5|nr:uncharacterized protein LOC120424563 isoform X3 [Culex pipiens pallens]